MSIRNVLLRKKIGNTLYDIYTKTSATIVDYTRGSGQDAVATTVAAELARIDSRIDTLLGSGTINEAFDTIKEIADWLQNTDTTSAATIVRDLNNTMTDLGHASEAAQGEEGQEGYVAPKPATGLHADVEANAADIAALETLLGDADDEAGVTTAFARIKALEDVGSTKVEDGYAANGNPGDADYRAADADGVIRVNGVAMVVYGGDPTIIQQDATHRFVTDDQIDSWDACVMYTTAASMTTYAANLQSNALYLVDLDNASVASGEDDVAEAYGA